MASKVPGSARRASKAGGSRGRHRAGKGASSGAYRWLGAGAFTLGVGAALMAGAGTAGAETGTNDSPSSSAGESNSHPAGAAERSRSKTGVERSTARADKANDEDVAGNVSSDASAGDDDKATVSVSRTSRTKREVADEVSVPESDDDPEVVGLLSLPVAPVKDDTSAAGANRSAGAVPNTAPTVTVRSAGTPAMFTANVYGSIRATDPDRDKLTFTGSTTALGKVTVNAFGSFTYTPTKQAQHAAAAPNGTKNDVIAITVSDGFGGIVTTHLTVAIKPANSRPGGRATVNEPNPATGAVTGSVIGRDADGDALGFSGSGVTPRGNVVVNPDGTFVYTPTAEALAGASSLFKRSDRFKIIVTDGHGGTSTVTVSVTIPKPGTNKAPVLGNPQFSIAGINDGNGQVTGNIHATDPEGFGLGFRLNLGVDPGVGSVAVNGAGGFSFVPTQAAREAAYRSPGEDTVQFSAVVTDGSADTLVTITVPISAKAPAPQPPPTPSLNARVDAFVGATRGKTIAAPDGSYPGECVSLVKRFLKDVHGISAGAWGNAVDYRQGGSGGNQLAARGFVWRTDGNFQNGDILVWGSGAGTSFGHIGIWHAGKLYDQNNYGSGRATPARTANYSPYIPPGRLGYWRKA